MKPWIMCFFILTMSLVLKSQTTSYKEGLYIHYTQFTHNNPIPRHNLIFPDHSGEQEFWERFINQDTLSYYDSLNVIRHISIDSVFGLCFSGAPFVRTPTGFYKMTITGKLSCFPSQVQHGLVDPFWGVNFDRESVHSLANDARQASYLDYFVLDTRDGQYYSMTRETVAKLMESDELLHSQFQSLKKKEQKKLMFFYLRRFNERNPW